MNEALPHQSRLATGRAVSRFLSSVSMEPLYAVEIFRLVPHESNS